MLLTFGVTLCQKMAPKRVQKVGRNPNKKGESTVKGVLLFARFWVHFLAGESEDSGTRGPRFDCNCTWRWFSMFRIFAIFWVHFLAHFSKTFFVRTKKWTPTGPKSGRSRHPTRWRHVPAAPNAAPGSPNRYFLLLHLFFASLFLINVHFFGTDAQTDLAPSCKYTSPRTTERRRRKVYKSKKAKRASAQRPTREFRRCARATGIS